MANIEITETGLKLPAINAGDEIGITVSESVEMADDAAYRVVVLGPIRGGGRALIAVSGKLQSSCRTGVISLQTTQARDLFRPLLPTDSVPARVEVIDEASGRFVAGSTTTLRNSFALWSVDAFPAQSFLSGDTFETLRAAIDAHEARRDNPHGVTAEQVGAEAAGAANAAVEAHNASDSAHADIRDAVENAYIRADEACEAVDYWGEYLSRHTTDKTNPHSVTEAQVVEASGTQSASGKYLRLFDENNETGKFSNEKLTFFGKTIFKGDTECGVTKIADLEVTGGAIVHTVLAVFDGPFYMEDLDNPGSMYELSVRGGKLYFNNLPISSDSVRSLKA